jgi:opacity protein-like surface antigen
MHHTFLRFAAISCFMAACATTATAQTTVRVSADQSTIWTHDFASPAAIVSSGLILTVVGQRKDWYEVVVPGHGGANRLTGFIFKSLVRTETAPVPPPARERPAASARSRPEGSHAFGLVGFGQFSYMRFAAQNSFQAVTGQAGGAFLGGGAELRVGSGLFLGGSIDRFTNTGQRVVVIDREVFGLGVPNTITLVPMAVTAGWRFEHERATPYVGGGIGRILYKETSSFADAAENVDTRFTTYHVRGGVELRNGWVATAFEVEYSRIPDAIGLAGASAAFQESNLGGIVGRIKILVGR